MGFIRILEKSYERRVERGRRDRERSRKGIEKASYNPRKVERILGRWRAERVATSKGTNLTKSIFGPVYRRIEIVLDYERVINRKPIIQYSYK